MDFELCIFSLYSFIYCAYYLIDLRLILSYYFASVYIEARDEPACIHTLTDCDDCTRGWNCPLKDKNVVGPKDKKD